MNGIVVWTCGFGKVGVVELRTYCAVDYRGDCDYYFVCGVT